MKTIIRPLAREDILRQYRYHLVEEVQPEVADRFLLAVQNSIEHVAKHLGVGAPVELQNPKLAGLRSWRVTGFPAIRVYYLVEEDVLRVIRISHGKRDIRPLLESADEK
jgi:toxin ParE1/3/4